MASYSLTSKTALVTGGARGIGLATAHALAARGANVVITDLDADDVERAAAEVHPTNALGIAADVTDADAMDAVVEEIVERFGGLDVVVANAGIAQRAATALATEREQFERVLEVNLLGVWRTVRAALPQIAERGGHVVVISSIYAFANGMGEAAYAMSKAGVEQLGRALRAELQPHGASATVAYFGFIDTEMVRQAMDRDPLVDRLRATTPKPLLKRLPPSVAGEAIVAAVEARKPRLIRPRRWIALSVLRGILNPLLDARIERDPEIQAMIREFDARAGERTPTTA
jgi:NAD(P)-dependent dehydrogenase (short-subunit alcohol dehydrogenase family)